MEVDFLAPFFRPSLGSIKTAKLAKGSLYHFLNEILDWVDVGTSFLFWKVGYFSPESQLLKNYNNLALETIWRFDVLKTIKAIIYQKQLNFLVSFQNLILHGCVNVMGVNIPI